MDKLEKLQRQCKDDYGLDIDIHRLMNLKRYVKEARKAYSVLSNVRKGEYSEYLKEYEKLKLRAHKLGIAVSEPLRNPKYIKHDISEIFTLSGFNDMFHRSKMLEWMGLSESIKNLPRIDLVALDDDEWDNYTPTEEEHIKLHQDFEDYYNSQL